MQQPAPSPSEGLLSAKDRFFLCISRITIPATYGDFLRSSPCQPPWPLSSFPRKRESRHGQLGWHNKKMKIMPSTCSADPQGCLALAGLRLLAAGKAAESLESATLRYNLSTNCSNFLGNLLKAANCPSALYPSMNIPCQQPDSFTTRPFGNIQHFGYFGVK
jgi:hypothetical protein